jgi:succinate dehydrogenase / fumarate reductase cytochrome b subunit
VQLLDLASMFGRHEFLIRRLHSLLGLIPIGGYLVFHLATNAAILDGLAAYQHRADQIHVLGPTTILILEWSVIFLPILMHALVGLVIVTRGQRNARYYPYEANLRYTLQRFTGVVAFLFIFWHVFQMHGWFRMEWWIRYVAEPLGGARFDFQRAYTAAEVLQSSWIVAALYAAGTLACVYHLANGIWTMGVTWGAWTSPRAQRWAKVPCGLFGLALAVVGMGALVGMLQAKVPEPRAPEPPSPSLSRYEALLESVPGFASVGAVSDGDWCEDTLASPSETAPTTVPLELTTTERASLDV